MANRSDNSNWCPEQSVGALCIVHPLLTMNEVIAAKGKAGRNRRGSWYDPYNIAKQSLEDVIKTCAFRDHFRYVGPCWTFCYTTKRRVDPDNLDAGARKLIFDALQRCNKLPSDTIEHVREIRSTFEKGPGERLVVLSSEQPLTEEEIEQWRR